MCRAGAVQKVLLVVVAAAAYSLPAILRADGKEGAGQPQAGAEGQPIHFDPGDPITLTRFSPLPNRHTNATVQVSPGEEIIFSAQGRDNDRYQNIGGGPWTTFVRKRPL